MPQAGAFPGQGASLEGAASPPPPPPTRAPRTRQLWEQTPWAGVTAHTHTAEHKRGKARAISD